MNIRKIFDFLGQIASLILIGSILLPYFLILMTNHYIGNKYFRDKKYNIYFCPKIYWTTARYIFKTSLILLGVNIETEKKLTLNLESEPSIYMYQHSSYLDVMTALTQGPQYVCIAKQSLFKIPVVS